MISLDGGLFEGPVHAFDLPVGPRVARFGQSMIDVVLGTGKFKTVRPEWLVIIECDSDIGGRPVGLAACDVG